MNWMTGTLLLKIGGIFFWINIIVLIIQIFRLKKRRQNLFFMKNIFFITIFIIGVVLTILLLHENYSTIKKNETIPLLFRADTPYGRGSSIAILLLIWLLPIINYFMYLWIKKRLKKNNCEVIDLPH